MVSKRAKKGCYCPFVHNHKQSRRHHKADRPITVSKILKPVGIERVKQPVAVAKVLQPLSVAKITAPVTVKTIQSPVAMFPLRQNVDNVTIYGSNSALPVQTDDLGRIVFSGQVQVSPVVYSEKSFASLKSGDQPQSLPAQDLSIQTNLSYAIVNRSEKQVLISLEISPNDMDYTLDTQVAVPGFTTKAITPLRFLRFAKISYQSAVTGESATFDVFYQAQSG